MKVTMFWHGGSSYATFDVHNPKDAENFDSIKDALNSFYARARSDPYYPCVDVREPDDGGPEAWLFMGANVIGHEYPDRIISFGPRGGTVISRC